MGVKVGEKVVIVTVFGIIVILVCLLSTNVLQPVTGNNRSSVILQPVVVSVNSSITECPVCDTERETNSNTEEEWTSSYLYQIEEILANKSGEFNNY